MGQEMYALHDNGRKLFTSPQDCTPAQRFVYVIAKNEHTDDPTKGGKDPRGFEEAKRYQDSTANFR